MKVQISRKKINTFFEFPEMVSSTEVRDLVSRGLDPNILILFYLVLVNSLRLTFLQHVYGYYALQFIMYIFLYI